MVERQEVEALLAYVEMKMESDKVELPPSVSDATLADLCRAWLALEAAPVGEYEHVTESVAYVHFDYELYDSGMDGQRVRIVLEEIDHD